MNKQMDEMTECKMLCAMTGTERALDGLKFQLSVTCELALGRKLFSGEGYHSTSG